jgi:hypothetical protein
MAEWSNGKNGGRMAEWRNGGMTDGMAEWQKEWQNGRMAGLATYVLFMVHTDTDTDTDTTLIFYSIDLLRMGWRNFFSSCAVVSVFGSGGK